MAVVGYVRASSSAVAATSRNQRAGAKCRVSSALNFREDYSSRHLAFVGVWIAAGVLLDMSPHSYLVFGIPLTAGFQLFVRKRPIKDLWVRGGPGLSLRTVSLKLAILLAIYPFVRLVQWSLAW